MVVVEEQEADAERTREPGVVQMRNSKQRCWFECARRGGNTEEEAG
jgi:hypothetical protein